MPWVREHDGELFDAKVGALTPLEYVELHALRQYVAREHPGAGGIFGRDELPSIAYLSSGKGARSVRRATLERFIRLGLVRELGSYSEQELAELEEGERTNRRVAYAEAAAAIREELASVDSAASQRLRVNRWEHYNGYGDRTAAARQAAHRAKLEEDVTRDVTRESRLPRTRVPSRPGTSTQAVSQGAEADDLDFGGALRVARVLQAIGGASLEDADTLRGLVSRSSEATVAKLLESLAGGSIVSPVAYSITMLRKELTK